jgi:hypothetical protein
MQDRGPHLGITEIDALGSGPSHGDDTHFTNWLLDALNRGVTKTELVHGDMAYLSDSTNHLGIRMENELGGYMIRRQISIERDPPNLVEFDTVASSRHDIRVCDGKHEPEQDIGCGKREARDYDTEQDSRAERPTRASGHRLQFSRKRIGIGCMSRQVL